MPQTISQKAFPSCDLPVSTWDLLLAAVQHWEDSQASDHYIQQAIAKNAEVDVFVSAYRYYFYKSNAPMALKMATAVADAVREREQWPTDWQTLKPILLTRLDDSCVRLYISAYAASGLLQARLGDFEIAQNIAEQVQQLHAKEFGADILLNILSAPSDEEE
ncbi:hypothetical protein PN498_14680 [Oscillatoria sp. CS-180]|uniref:hypothetical protein n=1 Tax=Oscillatoria sp. CS-180 TaxID=3021720 RepID=UPI00232E3180|nr:hypothetical protein [Oscillatoria sp. CS-180]MDB9527242.1 hypothetical protein [Oscillatoria sp. CS-180]